MLSGKVAFVTGGSRGIGGAIVRRLVAAGAKVAFTYASSTGDAAALVSTVAEAGGGALAVRADSADRHAIQCAIDQTVATFGRLDILVNNAGILLKGSIESFGLEEFDRIIAVNVRGVFVAVQASIPHLPDGGRIITIGSSMADVVTFPGVSAYAMTKGAVATLMQGIALDLAPRKITVNTVQPGPVQTDMAPDEHTPASEALRSVVPLMRLGRPEEIADMVAYLAGPEAGFVTGARLTIDGGFRA